MLISDEMLKDKREQLADLEHRRWSDWMNYVFSLSSKNEDGSVTIPFDKVERWKRQCTTSYNDLSEKEKDRDRIEVDKTIAMILKLDDRPLKTAAVNREERRSVPERPKPNSSSGTKSK